jgi:hypothetical protein
VFPVRGAGPLLVQRHLPCGTASLRLCLPPLTIGDHLVPLQHLGTSLRPVE